MQAYSKTNVNHSNLSADIKVGERFFGTVESE